MTLPEEVLGECVGGGVGLGEQEAVCLVDTDELDIRVGLDHLLLIYSHLVYY